MGADAKIARARQLIADGMGERAIHRETGLSRHQVRKLFGRPGTVSGARNSTELSHYDTACRALADAKDLSEVKEIADKAVAIKEYARRAKDRDMEVNAAELRIRAERRLGEMLIDIKETVGLDQGRRSDLVPKENQVTKPTLTDIGIDKKLSSRAQKLAVFDESSFGERLEAWRDRAAGEASRVSIDMLRESEQSERRAAHAAKTFSGGTVDDLHKLIASGFRAAAILADPPWKFISRSERGEGRSANQHYRTDALDLIKALPVAQLAAPDAVLFMWMVDWCPQAALDVIEAWGFAHKTTAFTWAKQNEGGEGWHMGQGYWTRANPEACWLATRGSPKRLYADVRQLIVAPVMEHSRKPDEAYDRIERLVQGPYLEIYARRERKGWMSWGDELAFRLPESEPRPSPGLYGDSPVLAAAGTAE